jgi:hypothetical protein
VFSEVCYYVLAYRVFLVYSVIFILYGFTIYGWFLFLLPALNTNRRNLPDFLSATRVIKA